MGLGITEQRWQQALEPRARVTLQLCHSLAVWPPLTGPSLRGRVNTDVFLFPSTGENVASSEALQASPS